MIVAMANASNDVRVGDIGDAGGCQQVIDETPEAR